MQAADAESWEVLMTLLPTGWQREAFVSGSVKRLRGFATVSDLMRTLLLHVGNGYSLRETATRAKASGLAEIADGSLWERVQAAGPWWRRLCVLLLEENGMRPPRQSGGRVFRVLDGTVIEESGKSGSSWRLHYSLRLPELECDHFEITPARARGGGEHLCRVPARAGECLLADRGFCRTDGVRATVKQGADLVVRLNTGNLPLYTATGQAWDLLSHVRELQQARQYAEWEVYVGPLPTMLPLRLCGVRKSEYGIERALAQIRRQASKHGSQPKPETLEYAKYVLVVSTLPRAEFPTLTVLDWYRLRWQIELVFKRLKSLARMGCLAKHDPQSVHSWIYGKLLMGLLTHKLIRVGREFSPWGYPLPER